MIGLLAAGAVYAQAVVLKPRGSATGAGTSNITVATRGAEVFAAIRATNADARTLFRELSSRTGAKILRAPSGAAVDWSDSLHTYRR